MGQGTWRRMEEIQGYCIGNDDCLLAFGLYSIDSLG